MQIFRCFLGTLLLGFGLHTTAFAGPPGLSPVDVNVTNTPLVVNVGTPTVNAQQQGTWNVGLSGTPGVTIQNAPTNPVPVQQVSATPATRIAMYDTRSLSENRFIDVRFGIDAEVTDVIISLQGTPDTGADTGCSISWSGALIAPGISWFVTGGNLGNVIKQFHFDPPIPNPTSNPFAVRVHSNGSRSGIHCHAAVTLLGIRR